MTLLMPYSFAIHIGQQKPNDYYLHLKHDNKGKTMSSAFKSEVSSLCYKLYNTYQYLGPESLTPYRDCKGKYELGGYSDAKMREENPFCYLSVESFYCHYYIDDSDSGYSIDKNKDNIIKNNNDNYPTSDETRAGIERMLSVIKNCLYNNNKGEYICEGIDYFTQKIKDTSGFCNNAERIIKNKDSNIYIPLKNIDKPLCKHVTDVYNICITSKQIIPNATGKDCLVMNNIITYLHSFVVYNENERRICNEFLLPVFATKSGYSNIYQSDYNFCDNFEMKIMQDYSKAISDYTSEISNYKTSIGILLNSKDENTKIKEITGKTLSSFKNITNNWVNFYAELSSTFKIRKEITWLEKEKFNKLKQFFKGYLPFSFSGYQFSKEQEISFDQNNKLFPVISAQIQKGLMYNDELHNNIQDFNYIGNSNKNLTIAEYDPISSGGNNNPEEESSVIEESELDELQNDYVNVGNYVKRYGITIKESTAKNEKYYGVKQVFLDNKISKIDSNRKRIEDVKKEFININK